MRVVVKIGTSSITTSEGNINSSAVSALCDEVATLRKLNHEVLIVTSGAVAGGVAALKLSQRPTDMLTMQALAAAGQSRLMQEYNVQLDRHQLVSAQVLLVPNDFIDRDQYLHARQTLVRLLELGCVPVINENDAIASDEIRFGDNDRIAALVAHSVSADVLILLTDLKVYLLLTRALTRRQLLLKLLKPMTSYFLYAPVVRSTREVAVAWRQNWQRRELPHGQACARSSLRPNGQMW